MLKKWLIIGLSILMTTGCTLFRKPKPAPEPVKAEAVITQTDSENTATVDEPTEIVVPADELGGEPVEQVAAEVMEKPVSGAGGPQTAIDPTVDMDSILSDSIWVDYMIKPGDYLSLIAYNEYGNANEWNRIYNWNKEQIGDDPDVIFPYNELDLKKPKGNAIEFEYEFTTYTVKAGESLWSISKKVYKDEYAWVVLFWDNEKMLNNDGGLLEPGMELKIRTALWPDYKK